MTTEHVVADMDDNTSNAFALDVAVSLIDLPREQLDAALARSPTSHFLIALFAFFPVLS